MMEYKMRKHLFMLLGFTFIILTGCSHSESKPETKLPVYGTSQGSKVLGNGNMVLLFGNGSEQDNRGWSFHNLYIGDYSRVIMRDFRLDISSTRDSLQETLSSFPWFAATYKGINSSIVYQYHAFVPAFENAILIYGSVTNQSRNRIHVSIQPHFQFDRETICDHYENYSNLYADEFIFSYGFSDDHNTMNTDEIASPREMLLAPGQTSDFRYVIAISKNTNKAANIFRKLSVLPDPAAYGTQGWTKWIKSGIEPDFGDSLLRSLYRINLAGLRAVNLKGAVPADLSGEFMTDSLPQIYPRDALMTARAFLETGHFAETDQILNYWVQRPMKQEGEWYARYDAFGNPNDGGSGARYNTPEWDSNGYFASLIYRYRQITGQVHGDLNLMRSLLQFPEARLHSNNLPFEGGIIEWPAYLPSTAMSLTAAYEQAANVTQNTGRYLESAEFAATAQKLASGLPTLFDESRNSYIDQRDTPTWNSSTIFGWIYGFPDHDELRLSTEYYWQFCRKQNGGIQYFDSKGYGDDLFFFNTAAMAEYYAFSGRAERYHTLLNWMTKHCSIFGLCPERIVWPSETFPPVSSKASPLTWSGAEYVMALLEGARYGMLGQNDTLRMTEERHLKNSLFPDRVLQDSMEIRLAVDSLWTGIHLNERQKLLALESRDSAAANWPVFDMDDYPSECIDGKSFIIPFRCDDSTLASLDSVTLSYGPDSWALAIDSLQYRFIISTGDSIHYRDRNEAAILNLYFSRKNHSTRRKFPVQIRMLSPLQLDVPETYCSDTLALFVSNRSAQPRVIQELLTADSLTFTLPAVSERNLLIPLPPTLAPGPFTLALRLTDDRDSVDYSSVQACKVRVLDLSGLWYIDTHGNEEEMVNGDYGDITSLPQITLPDAWENQGYEGLDGIVILSCYTVLPDLRSSRMILFQMGAVDDEDRSFFNGHLIGASQGWDKARNYPVDPRLIRRDNENLIQILVNDTGHNGGPWKQPLRLIYY